MTPVALKTNPRRHCIVRSSLVLPAPPPGPLSIRRSLPTMSYYYYPVSFPSIPEDMDAWSRPSDMAYGSALAYDGSHARTGMTAPISLPFSWPQRVVFTAPSTPPPPPPQVGIAPSHNGATDALLIQYPIPRAPYIFTSTHNGPATYQALQVAASIVRPPIFPSASRPPVAHHQPLGPPLMPPLYLPVTEGIDFLDPLLPTQQQQYDTATLPSPDGQHLTPSTSSLFAALVPSLASSSEAPALENSKVTHQHTASLVVRSAKRLRPSPMAPPRQAPPAASTSSLAGALGNPETAHYEYRGHNRAEFVARLCIPLPLRSPHDPTRTFRVPLPPNTDVFFDPVSVGGVLGLACHQCSSVRKSRANPYIFENVDRARMSLDHAFDRSRQGGAQTHCCAGT